AWENPGITGLDRSALRYHSVRWPRIPRYSSRSSKVVSAALHSPDLHHIITNTLQEELARAIRRTQRTC
ncbi:hypothetical protein MPH_01589, partial [Macrophomina phaseolina MS6]